MRRKIHRISGAESLRPKRLLLLGFALSAAAGAYAMPRHVDVVLKPQRAHEECFRLESQQRMQYTFSAEVPIQFNLHYHAGREVVYPIKSEGVTEQRGNYVAATAQEYCLMWTSRALGDVKLGYEFVIAEPGLTKQ